MAASAVLQGEAEQSEAEELRKKFRVETLVEERRFSAA